MLNQVKYHAITRASPPGAIYAVVTNLIERGEEVRVEMGRGEGKVAAEGKMGMRAKMRGRPGRSNKRQKKIRLQVRVAL